MSVSILNATFDCSDAASAARFWSEVTTWSCAREEMPGNPYWVVGSPAPGAFRLVFVEVPESRRRRTGFILTSFLMACHKIRRSTGSCRSARGSPTTAVMPRPEAGS